MIYLCSRAKTQRVKIDFCIRPNLLLKNLFINKTLAQLTKQTKCTPPTQPKNFPGGPKSINGILPKILQKSACKQKTDTSKNILYCTKTHTHSFELRKIGKQKLSKRKYNTQKMGIKFLFLLLFYENILNIKSVINKYEKNP